MIIKVPGINSPNNLSAECRDTGNLIISELRKIEINESLKEINHSLLNFEEIHLDNKDLELSDKLIFNNSFEVFENYPKLFFLGGDHSISFSLGRAFKEYCSVNKKVPCLIIFDSRPNLEFFNKYSGDIPDNGQWLRGLIESGFSPQNILLVGVRNFSKKELEYLNEKKIRFVSMNYLQANLHEACDTIMEFSNGRELYLSFDFSVVDPSSSPDSTFQDAGGFSSREFLYIAGRLSKMKNLKALDIVEIKNDSSEKTSVKLAAKFLAEFL